MLVDSRRPGQKTNVSNRMNEEKSNKSIRLIFQFVSFFCRFKSHALCVLTVL